MHCTAKYTAASEAPDGSIVLHPKECTVADEHMLFSIDGMEWKEHEWQDEFGYVLRWFDYQDGATACTAEPVSASEFAAALGAYPRGSATASTHESQLRRAVSEAFHARTTGA